MRTNPLQLVASQTPAFAYLPATRDLPQNLFTLPVIGVIYAASRESLNIVEASLDNIHRLGF
jgi:hypothetical protein